MNVSFTAQSTRRFLIILFLAEMALLTEGCFGLPDFADPPASVHRPGVEVAVPTSPDTPSVIPVTINGKGPFRCLVDPGSRGSVVSEKTAEAILPQSAFSDQKRRIKRGMLIPIDQWRAGGIEFNGFYAIVADPGNVDCILGANLMRNLSVGWDRSANMVLFDVSPDDIGEVVARIPISLSGGRPFVKATVNGVITRNALVAPGLPQSHISQRFTKKIKPDIYTESLSISIDLAGFHTPDVTVPIQREHRTGFAQKIPAVTIGGDLLDGVITVLDFRSRMLLILINGIPFTENNRNGETRTPSELPSGQADSPADTPAPPPDSYVPSVKDVTSPFFGQ